MNDNTKVYCNQDADNIAEKFSWNPILESADYLQRHPCNASIFMLEDKASISAYDKFICANPSDREVLDLVEQHLSEMATKYYGRKVLVTIDDFQLKYKVEFVAE